MIKVIGIDPGLAETGIGIISGRGQRICAFSYGCIRTTPEQQLARRLEMIYTKLDGLLVKESPDLMVAEDIFSLERYPQSGLKLGRVSGIILLAAAKRNIPVVEIPVREAKQVLTGNGNASKQQLEKCVRRILDHSEPIKPIHASDALGMALIGLFRNSSSVPCRSG
jgi:crossover junction endodeoxyribonuclease RuvC